MSTQNHLTPAPTQIVVLGAGYAGLLATLRLARRTHRQPVQITLINASPTFVERTRLHQQTSGQAIKPLVISELLTGTRVHFVQGKVSALHPNQRQVAVQSEVGEQAIHYDKLVYALGSHTSLAQLPGGADHAYTLEQHAAIRTRLEQLPPAARILVIGGGLTGIEAATELAEAYPHLGVTLATSGALGDDLAPAGACYLARVMHKLGIAVCEQTKIVRLEAGQALTDSGDRLSFDLCLYTAGFTVAPLARAAGLAVNAHGQVLVDALLRATSHPAIYAIGDAAAFAPETNLCLRMACATAMPMAAHVAENLARSVGNKPEQPFRFGYAARCISLGRNNGLVQLVDAADQPRPWVVTGRLGAWVKEQILQYTTRTLRLERHFSFYRWPQSQSAQRHSGVTSAQLSAEMVQPS